MASARLVSCYTCSAIWGPDARRALAEDRDGRALAAGEPCVSGEAPGASYRASAAEGESCASFWAEAVEPCAHVPEGDPDAVLQAAQTRCRKRVLPEPCLCRP